MARITTVSMSLVTVEDQVTITVNYLPVFSDLELFLMNHGLRFRDRIVVFGVDEPNNDQPPLGSFPFHLVTPPVPQGGGVRLIQRTKSFPRVALEEDAGIGDDDEIRCRIHLLPVGLPSIGQAFTETHTLRG
jgi:hypothetical protein